MSESPIIRLAFRDGGRSKAKHRILLRKTGFMEGEQGICLDYFGKKYKNIVSCGHSGSSRLCCMAVFLVVGVLEFVIPGLTGVVA
jgi:hypothetical protein